MPLCNKWIFFSFLTFPCLEPFHWRVPFVFVSIKKDTYLFSLTGSSVGYSHFGPDRCFAKKKGKHCCPPVDVFTTEKSLL
jgi:hypothetical protein